MKVGETLTFNRGEFNIFSARCTLTQLQESSGKKWKTKKDGDRYLITRIA